MAHKNVSFFIRYDDDNRGKIERKLASNFNIDFQNFLMRGSRQTLPTLLEECNSTKRLCEIAATFFDQGQAYSNSKVY